MEKKIIIKIKGFTLIELLAIIVIIAIVALIATPVVLNVISQAREKANINSVHGVVKAANMYFNNALGSSDKLKLNGATNILSELSLGGGKPISGEVYIDLDGKISLALRYGDRCYKKVFDSKDINGEDFVETSCKAAKTEIATSKDETGANPPNLAPNMIPVMWNGSSWVKADQTNKDNTYYWYDYATQMWANAVTVKASGTQTRAYYQSATVGTVIPEADILTYMVWIPRYEYKITGTYGLGGTYGGLAVPTQAQPGEIEVNFISGTSKNVTTNYKVHPAFTFGTDTNKELTGFWVGKFETGGTLSAPCIDTNCNISNVVVKPNVKSLRNQTVSSLFMASRSMSARSDNPYGNTDSIDMHMMKNSEWGAVAYLSQSKYGKYGNSSYTGLNREIYKNDSSGYYTGKSCGGPGSNSGTCSTSTIDGTHSYNEEGGATGASTTGTIYGVYDMSGGLNDIVMGVLSDSSDNPRSGISTGSNSGFNGTIYASGANTLWNSGIAFPDSRYYDLYTTTSAATACEGGVCYGHALSETTNWYSDNASFVSESSPWFLRGSNYSSITGAGVLSHSNYYGNASGNSGFHLVQR